jgi:hypothetical protein
MTVTVTHTKVSAIPDGADTTVVRPSDWNASHTLVGLGTAAELDAGVANGVATLDSGGKVPSSQLSGVVTSVTGTAPVVSSGGATPAISMAAATAAVNGYLTSTDWSTFNSKQAAFGSQTANYVYAAPNGSAGSPTFRAIVPQDLGTGLPSSANFLRGDGTWQTVASTPAGSNTQVQFNNAGAFGAAATFTWNGTSLSVPALAATTSVTTPLVQSSASNLALTASTGIVDASGNTGALGLAKGTTAERPASPTSGMTRLNTTTLALEYYNGSGWVTLSAVSYSVTALVIAGGGGGGNNKGGGGGAGGFLTSTTNSLTSGQTYTITVGAGGAAAAAGSNSAFASFLTSTGGGYGGSEGSRNGVTGGSGGGACRTGSIGTGTSGQGNNGGSGVESSPYFGGGGGGGAGAVGQNCPAGATGGAGGSGLASSITGSSVTYGGGGGGGVFNTSGSGFGGAGGSGGGGAAGNDLANGTAGTVNLGGGGGGGGNGGNGASGGSGVVILSIPTASYTGTTTGSPTVTTSGSNTILKYTASGTYTA